jgi:hypothetical protein
LDVLQKIRPSLVEDELDLELWFNKEGPGLVQPSSGPFGFLDGIPHLQRLANALDQPHTLRAQWSLRR